MLGMWQKYENMIELLRSFKYFLKKEHIFQPHHPNQ